MRAQNGWSGGQYSLVRAAFGIGLATRFALHAWGASGPEALLHASGIAWSLAFALGWAERSIAFALAPTLIAAGFVVGERGPGQVHFLALGVVLHLATPAAPFGSFDARVRVDPRGAWRMPRGVMLAARVFVVAIVGTFLLSRSRPYLALGWFGALACDPAWIRATLARGVERVFYDGTCGLCHRTVRFVLAETRDAARWRFAPLQGETFATLVAEKQRAELPDSVVVLTSEGACLTRSSAIVHLLASLGGAWRLVALALRIVPRALRDLGYDGIARIRKSVFGEAKTLCPLLPPELAARFDP